MGKREQGSVPTNPHGQRGNKRQRSWVITQIASYPHGYVGMMLWRGIAATACEFPVAQIYGLSHSQR
jgi:hypothetical protein